MGRSVARSPNDVEERDDHRHVAARTRRHPSLMRVVGIDGCSTGWIAIVWHGEPGPVAAHHLPVLADLAAVVPDVDGVAIDIPLFVPTDHRTGETDLRTFLGPRRSSVFSTPPAVALEASDYATANAAARDHTGRGISRQAWALVPKIREALEWVPTMGVPVIEAHPEASFAALLGHPATAGKKVWAGMSERLRALTGAGFDLRAIDQAAGRAAATDDLLDAAAAAWTAARYHRGQARSFPAVPDPPGDAIWA